MILLRKYQLVVNLKKIQRIKREYILFTKVRMRRPFIVNRQEQLENITAPNVLEMKFKQSLPDRVYS